MRTLSILHTESSLGWGGQEIRILSEARGMIARGHEVRVLGAEGSRIVEEAPAWGVPASALPIAKKRLVGLKCMLEWMKRERCHVVSTHSSTDAWLVAVSLYVLRRPCPVVRTRHISTPVSRNALTRWLYTRATTRIVTTGKALREELIQRNGFRADRIVSIPTGIDAARFVPGDRAAARASLGLPADGPLVGIVATLRSWKGHRYLVEALGKLPAPVQLVIVGEGPQRQALESLVAQSGMKDRVRFAGNQRDVLPWLQALDVFALPSYANEGVPQALIQAMMVGLPCVTTHVGSIAELAVHDKTALVIPPQDVDALASSIRKLLSEPEARERLGKEARAHCVQGYSYERMLDEMERVYREVSGRP
jgi:glycosyltransferase involved in cell wall biosynthesis